MCIALLSTAHPSYRLILLDNRDEYLNRPTAPATWWSPSRSPSSTSPTTPPQPSILSGRDLLRPAQGTWLGITRSGRIAVLTNFRDTDNPAPPQTPVSRGEIIKQFLTSSSPSSSSVPTSEFVNSVIDSGTARDAGGFSLVCGDIGGGGDDNSSLAVISNRASTGSSIPWICGPNTVQTVGLSNTGFTDRTWPKVLRGEELMLDVIRTAVRDGWDEDRLVEEFLRVLSLDTLPRMKKEGDDEGEDGGLGTYIRQLRNTIFVPVLGRRQSKEKGEMMRGDEIAAAKEGSVTVLDGPGGDGEEPEGKEVQDQAKQLGVSGLYGTQKQTVVLIDHDMNVRFFERTLFDQTPSPVPVGEGDVDIRFKIER